MAERLSVERSACRALATYLDRELSAVYGPGVVVVLERWPSPDAPLPELAVSLVLTGERDDSYTVEPSDHIRRIEPDPDPNFGIFTYMVKACRQKLQLDCWADLDVRRDELLFYVNDALQKGTDFTLGLSTAGDPVRDGPLLKLDPQYGFDGFVDFTFQGPSVVDQPDAVRQREYRASMAGSFDVNLTTKGRTPRLAADLLLNVS